MRDRLRYALGGGLGALALVAIVLGVIDLTVWIGGGLR